MIAAKGLSWEVQGARIVSEVTANFADATVTAILGRNGSGKTSLLHLLAGMRRPSAGRVLLEGQPLETMSARRRARRIALVEQHPSTDLELTADQVVRLGRIPHVGAWPGSRDRDREAVGEAMEVAGVSQLARRRWPTLSGGERQRVQLARALAQRPRVLLLDEPTNHLDLAHQLQFLATLRQLDICIVAVLHDLDLAAAYCDEALVMNAGKVHVSGAVSQVLTPGLIGEVFGVRAQVYTDDRLRVNWSKP